MSIYEAISKIIADCPAIAKNSRNDQNGKGYNYRGVDAVMNVFQPLLAKYKVFVVPQVLEHEREERVTKNGAGLIYSLLKVKYTFYSEDGSYVEAVVQGEGMDSGDKASNKAMSAAFKYAMFQTFCIPTEEMKDADAETPEESTPAPAHVNAEQIERIKELVADIPGMLKYYKIGSIEELTAEQAETIIKKKGANKNG